MRGIFNRKTSKAQQLAFIEEHYPSDALVNYAREGDVAGVKRVLKAGVDPNTVVWRDVSIDCMEDTPLHAAAGQGHIAVMKELLKAGADINKTIEENWTPVLQAAMDGQGDAIRFLAAQGAKLDEKETFFGHTALHKAARLGHVDSVAVLIEKGADRTIKDRHGKRALDEICAQKHLPEPDMTRCKDAIAKLFSDADAADRKKLVDAAAAKKAYEKELANAATLQNPVKPLRPVVLRKPKT
ncbi:MAG: ankyrin repeat domain-containing protein [Alphaproteobacteria bacterium]